MERFAGTKLLALSLSYLNNGVQMSLLEIANLNVNVTFHKIYTAGPRDTRYLLYADSEIRGFLNLTIL